MSLSLQRAPLACAMQSYHEQVVARTGWDLLYVPAEAMVRHRLTYVPPGVDREPNVFLYVCDTNLFRLGEGEPLPDRFMLRPNALMLKLIVAQKPGDAKMTVTLIQMAAC